MPVRRLILLLLAAAIQTIVLAAAPEDVRAQQSQLELSVQAAYLQKIPHYVDWPPPAANPFRLCVVGLHPYGRMIEDAVAAMKLPDRAAVVTRLSLTDDLSSCQMAFLSDHDSAAVAASLAQVGGRPVLTVTSYAGSPDVKGIIHFVIVDGKLRFEIDRAAASRQGLQISSKLLALAVNSQAGR